MDTLLYKVGCLLLFAFIFVQSFSGDSTNQPHFLSNSEVPAKQIIPQKTDVIAVDAFNGSIVANETTDYSNYSFNK